MTDTTGKAIEQNWQAYLSNKIFYDPLVLPRMRVAHRLQCCHRSDEMIEYTGSQPLMVNCPLCNDSKKPPLTKSLIKRRLLERFGSSSKRRKRSNNNDAENTNAPLALPLPPLDDFLNSVDVGVVLDSSYKVSESKDEETKEEQQMVPLPTDVLAPTPEEWTILMNFLQLDKKKNADRVAQAYGEATHGRLVDFALDAVQEKRKNRQLVRELLRFEEHAVGDDNKEEEKEKKQRRPLKLDQTGQGVCNWFFQSAMLAAYHKSSPSFHEAWSSDTRRRRIWSKYFEQVANKKAGFSPQGLIRAFSLGFYKVSNFRPLLATVLYDDYLVTNEKQKQKRVLDPCAGFGGRLMGFWFSHTCVEHVGIDPNPALVQPFRHMYALLQKRTPKANKRVTIVQACAETVNYDPSKLGSFDIIFTSPPYFDTERYAEDETQSSVRYPTIELWRDRFLFTMLKRCVLVLAPRGVLAINIANHSTWTLNIEKELVDFVAREIPNLTYRETVQLPFPVIGSESFKTEPCFIWENK